MASLLWPGAIVLGPRIGKYGPDGKPRSLAAHNIPMALLGTFILLFGWFGFNAASTFAATDVRFAVVATNTAIAGAFGAVIAMFCVMKRMGKPDPGMMANGMLAGLVAITAPCAFVQPWAAAVIGIDRRGHRHRVRSSSGSGRASTTRWVRSRSTASAVCSVCSVVGIFSDGRYGVGVEPHDGNKCHRRQGRHRHPLRSFELRHFQLGSAAARR